jgi:hypothetical protein
LFVTVTFSKNNRNGYYKILLIFREPKAVEGNSIRLRQKTGADRGDEHRQRGLAGLLPQTQAFPPLAESIH